jgi:hypothetical protein
MPFYVKKTPKTEEKEKLISELTTEFFGARLNALLGVAVPKTDLPQGEGGKLSLLSRIEENTVLAENVFSPLLEFSCGFHQGEHGPEAWGQGKLWETFGFFIPKTSVEAFLRDASIHGKSINRDDLIRLVSAILILNDKDALGAKFQNFLIREEEEEISLF